MNNLFPVLLLIINQRLLSLLDYIQLLELNEDAIYNFLIFFKTTYHYKLQVESWVDKYLEYDFFKLFRMTQESFNILLKKVIGLDVVTRFQGGVEPTPAHTQLLMTLWWLGKGDTFISTAERFSVAESTVFFCTSRMLDKIIQLRYQYIVWPSENDMVSIAEEFRIKSGGIPGINGVIDGCNIKFKPPKEQHDSYIDRNSNYSIKLQAVCTINKVITNINVGMPGSVHDIRMFRNSNLYQEITRNNQKHKYFPGDYYHIIGDKAYPLLPWLMTPFKNYGNLSERKKRYNESVSKARIIIEHTFGWLKTRWRILKGINCNSVVKTVKIIVACCVLHNFCILQSDFWDYIEEAEEVIQDEEINEEENTAAAVLKRTQIEMLFEQ